MKTRLFRFVLSVSLAAALMIMPISVSFAASNNLNTSAALATPGDAVIENKEEVIYATLAAGGEIRSIYAVNHFDVNGAGNVYDHGKYTSVVNLSSTDPLANEGDAVTFHAEEGHFYYQGNMAENELPWKFELAYYLDGVKIAPADLAGKAGKLEMHMTTKQNDKVKSTFYENYMLQISVTLDNEKCGSIKAPGGMIANSGESTIIAYTVMPKKDADLCLTASVRDFSMSGIQISGLPLSITMELPDTEAMVSDFEKLSDAISELNDGVGELTDGVADLKTGAGKLNNGSADVKNGLSELSRNSGQLIDASSQINNALFQISSSLGNSPKINIDDFFQLPVALSQLSGGLTEISGGLMELKNGFSAAYSALDSAIAGIPDTTVTQEQIFALYSSTDPSQHGLLDQLIASYTAGQTVKGTYLQVKGAFDAVGPTIDTLSGSIGTIVGALNEMSKKMSDSLSGMDMLKQLEQLSFGLSELSKNFTVFHTGLIDYMAGVYELATGYSDFHNGITAFKGGMRDLYDGVAELHDGTAELHEETAEMPDTLQSEIDDLMDEYTGSDFKPVSFLSSQNANTGLVQFVLKCDGIEKPEETKELQAEQVNETIWDRFIALFKRIE